MTIPNSLAIWQWALIWFKTNPTKSVINGLDENIYTNSWFAGTANKELPLEKREKKTEFYKT